MRTEFISTGIYLPDRVVTNDDLAKMMDTSDEWIRARTGIEQRRWIREGQLTSDLALEAAKMALDRADMRPSDLDALSSPRCRPSTCSRQRHISPSQAWRILHPLSGRAQPVQRLHLWAVGGGRMDQDRSVQTCVLGGAEVQSTRLDTTSRGRDLAMLFGDGAGVAILGATDEPERGILSTHLFADGSQAKLLWCDLGGTAHAPRITHELIDQGLHLPIMRGNDVYSHAARLMPEAARIALEANDLALDDVRLLVAHQANLRILQMVQKRLGLREDQVFNNIQRYGNTTAATIPIALHEALEQGRLARGDVLILTAFGGGLTWASAAVRW
jgi:3-oxoacyl-[acyl-carrier-protein] synthase III